MSIKYLVLAASMLLALSPAVSVTTWAASHEKAEEMEKESVAEMECVPQAEIDAMSDEGEAQSEEKKAD